MLAEVLTSWKLLGWEAVLPFKAGESKLGLVSMPKALANTDTLSEITHGFSTVKEKCHLIPASGLNLVNKELSPAPRIEKNNGRDQVVRSQSQVRFTSCIYTRTLMAAAKNKSDPLTPRLLGHVGWGKRWRDSSSSSSWALSNVGLDHPH